MVFEITAGLGALCGAIHRLGKLGIIPAYGYEREREWPAGFKLVMWGFVLATVVEIGRFEDFESGLLFGLVFVGAWKLTEEAAELVADCVEGLRSR